ncbi:MAG: sulfatase-like hydrolase/transferase [Planctomycetota bacterium]
MTPLRILALVLIALLISIPSCGGEGPTAAPGAAEAEAMTGSLKGRSFVLVVADSLHAGHLSAYGYERETSPFLERLSSMGVRAERALSQTSWTLSSVISLFTGLVQERHGILMQTQVLGPDGPRTLAEMFTAAGYRSVGFNENAAAGPFTGAGKGFESYDLKRFDLGRGEDTLNEARAVLNQSLSGESPPLFLYVHILPPHMPYTPPEPFASLFNETPSSLITGTIEDVAQTQARGIPRSHADNQRLIETYDAHIAYADDRIRRLLEPALTSHPEKLCVVFTSDHGEAFLQHGATGHNTFTYEEFVSIPWILAAPGAIPANLTLPGPVSILDTVPTIAQLFDLDLPATSLDGTSLLETFAGLEDGAPTRPLASRELFISSRYPPEGRGAQFALVEGDWKLIARRRQAPPLLFNTSKDPEEQTDVSADHQGRLTRMSSRMADIRTGLVEEAGAALSAPLSATMLRDLEALGYGGADFELPKGK